MDQNEAIKLRHVHHRCEHCNAQHEIYKGELKRGRGVYCSKECRLHHARDEVTTTNCEICNTQFNTHVGRKRCSIECESIE